MCRELTKTSRCGEGNAAKFMPLIYSAEKFKPPRFNYQDKFVAKRCVCRGVTPPISGLADFVEGTAATLD
jgi:hypothetical protein